MAISEKELERIIGSHLSRELDANIEVPDINNQWQNIKKQLLEVDNPSVIKNPFLKHKRTIVAATIILSVGSLNFIYPNNTNALGGKIAEFFTYMVGKTTRNITTTYSGGGTQGGNQDIPTAVNLGHIIQKEVTLDQAQASVDYKLAIPSYLPPETKINRVLISAVGTDVSEISIEYIYNDNVIVFTQEYITHQYSSGSTYDTDDTVVKDLIVNGSPAILFMHKHGMSTMNWNLRSLVLEITGKLTEEEIIKMANSIH